MAILLTVGMILGVLAPPLRRYGKASSAILACAASLVIAVAVVDLLHPDPRIGVAAIDANRRFYRILLAFEVPALALALVSLRGFQKAFWAGWIIHGLFALRLVVILLWLQLFWHW
jgi:hypothetical protein